MLRAFSPKLGRFATITDAADVPEGTTWFDLVFPDANEERIVETALGIEVPTREEMIEIEPSSRLYEEDQAAYMTANVLCKADTDHPESTAVTFIVSTGVLVTVRYGDPTSIGRFSAHAERHPNACASGSLALVGLLEAVIDRTADILERVGTDLDQISNDLFARQDPAARTTAEGSGYEVILRKIGRNKDLSSKARDSLVSINRVIGFLSLPEEFTGDRDLRARIKTLSRDVLSLKDHASSLHNDIAFLLDATLGMINIEQNGIIKIFSVVAVIFLPPTLVASIYGMNFEVMPELGWPLGYPFALFLMVLSGLLPYLYFKRRGWL